MTPYGNDADGRSGTVDHARTPQTNGCCYYVDYVVGLRILKCMC